MFGKAKLTFQIGRSLRIQAGVRQSSLLKSLHKFPSGGGIAAPGRLLAEDAIESSIANNIHCLLNRTIAQFPRAVYADSSLATFAGRSTRVWQDRRERRVKPFHVFSHCYRVLPWQRRIEQASAAVKSSSLSTSRGEYVVCIARNQPLAEPQRCLRVGVLRTLLESFYAPDAAHRAHNYHFPLV